MNMADYEVRVVGPRRSTEDRIPLKVTLKKGRGDSSWCPQITFSDLNEEIFSETSTSKLCMSNLDDEEYMRYFALEKAHELMVECHIYDENNEIEIIPSSRKDS